MGRARNEGATDDLALRREGVGIACCRVDRRGHAHEDLRAGRELPGLCAEMDEEARQCALLPVQGLLQRNDVPAVTERDDLVWESLRPAGP